MLHTSRSFRVLACDIKGLCFQEIYGFVCWIGVGRRIRFPVNDGWFLEILRLFEKKNENKTYYMKTEFYILFLLTLDDGGVDVWRSRSKYCNTSRFDSSFVFCERKKKHHLIWNHKYSFIKYKKINYQSTKVVHIADAVCRMARF